MNFKKGDLVRYVNKEKDFFFAERTSHLVVGNVYRVQKISELGNVYINNIKHKRQSFEFAYKEDKIIPKTEVEWLDRIKANFME